MPGWGWWFLLTGKVPKVKVGNIEIPWIPGSGACKLIWWAMLSGQQPEIKFEEIEKVKVELEEIKKKLDELKAKLQ